MSTALPRFAATLFAAFACLAQAQDKPSAAEPAAAYEPRPGQEGKDVIWLPTPQVVVDKMLDVARVGPKDFVMDLGSGDGRTVITAARRGATAVGIEYNPDMVEFAKRSAEKAGVSQKASFVKADLFATSFARASVITMFLLPGVVFAVSHEKEAKLCYYLDPIKREVSQPVKNGVPFDVICQRLKKQSAEICAL